MPMHVVNGALLRCSCGAAPSALVVLPVLLTIGMWSMMLAAN